VGGVLVEPAGDLAPLVPVDKHLPRAQLAVGERVAGRAALRVRGPEGLERTSLVRVARFADEDLRRGDGEGARVTIARLGAGGAIGAERWLGSRFLVAAGQDMGGRLQDL
jgi:hypothetical protein